VAGKKTKVVDGFSVVRGLARAQQQGLVPPPGSLSTSMNPWFCLTMP